MSKADEIFYEEDFEKIEKHTKEGLKEIEYKTNYQYIANTTIIFDFNTKTILIHGQVNIDILQAINEKVKELGWLGE